MQMSNQPPIQFAVLTLTGIALTALTVLIMTDYRGVLTRYAHSCWLTYQRPWYQRFIRWTRSARAHTEASVRRTAQRVAGIALVMGLLILVLEFSALVTGHVS